MKRIILFAIAFLICSPHLVLAETVSLSTYYPAPFGTYDRLRLVPRDPIVGVCRVGTMYTENVNNTLRYCREVGGGPDAGSWGAMPGTWERDGANNVFLLDTATVLNYRVGIGDLTPEAVLEVSSSNQGFDLFMLSTDDNTDGDLFVVKSDGKVGIGTTGPVNKLDVEGGVAIGASYSGTSAAPANGLIVEGVVGIGVTAPGAKLEIVGDAGTNFSNLLILNNSNNDAAGIFLDAQNRDWAIAATNPASGFGDQRLIFYDNNAGFPLGARMIIDQNGNIDITGNVTTLKALAVPAPGTPEKLNVDGRINLRDNGGWGRLMVEYDAGTQGYYAVYAP